MLKIKKNGSDVAEWQNDGKGLRAQQADEEKDQRGHEQNRRQAGDEKIFDKRQNVEAGAGENDFKNAANRRERHEKQVEVNQRADHTEIFSHHPVGRGHWPRQHDLIEPRLFFGLAKIAGDEDDEHGLHVAEKIKRQKAVRAFQQKLAGKRPFDNGDNGHHHHEENNHQNAESRQHPKLGGAIKHDSLGVGNGQNIFQVFHRFFTSK